MIKEFLRADKFVENHIEYLTGRILIADAKIYTLTQPLTVIPQDALEKDMHASKYSDIPPTMGTTEEHTSEEESDLSVIKIKKIKNKANCNNLHSDSESGTARPEVLASREIENWRGKGHKVKQIQRTGRYLGQRLDEVSDALKLRANRQIPILRNGSALNLQPPMVGGRPVTVINTYAFDSLCQSILIACMDFSDVEKFISEKSSSIPMFNLITEVIKTGTHNGFCLKFDSVI